MRGFIEDKSTLRMYSIGAIRADSFAASSMLKGSKRIVDELGRLVQLTELCPNGEYFLVSENHVEDAGTAALHKAPLSCVGNIASHVLARRGTRSREGAAMHARVCRWVLKKRLVGCASVVTRKKVLHVSDEAAAGAATPSWRHATREGAQVRAALQGSPLRLFSPLASHVAVAAEAQAGEGDVLVCARNPGRLCALVVKEEGTLQQRAARRLSDTPPSLSEAYLDARCDVTLALQTSGKHSSVVGLHAGSVHEGSFSGSSSGSIPVVVAVGGSTLGAGVLVTSLRLDGNGLEEQQPHHLTHVPQTTIFCSEILKSSNAPACVALGCSSSVKLMDIGTRRLRSAVRLGKNRDCTALGTQADSWHSASGTCSYGTRDGQVGLFGATTKDCVPLFRAPTFVTGVSGHGEELFVRCADGSLTVWDTRFTGRSLCQLIEGQTNVHRPDAFLLLTRTRWAGNPVCLANHNTSVLGFDPSLCWDTPMFTLPLPGHCQEKGAVTSVVATSMQRNSPVLWAAIGGCLHGVCM